jgi:hypothetical protein
VSFIPTLPYLFVREWLSPPRVSPDQIIHEEPIGMLSFYDHTVRNGGRNRPKATDMIMGDGSRQERLRKRVRFQPTEERKEKTIASYRESNLTHSLIAHPARITTTNRHSSHVNYLAVAMGLNWSISTMTMRQSSDGRPRHQQPVKLVATGKRWRHLCSSQLKSIATTGNDDANIAHHYYKI